MPPDPSLLKPGRTQGHNQGPPQAPTPQIAGCLVPRREAEAPGPGWQLSPGAGFALLRGVGTQV